MNQVLVDKITHAVLYEGYILYPYRPSVKNRQRWTFGGLCPQTYSAAQGGADAWSMQTQCLVQGSLETAVSVRVRFLHLVARSVGEIVPPLGVWPEEGVPAFRVVDSLDVGEMHYESWQEAVERDIVLNAAALQDLVAQAQEHAFAFPASHELEPLRTPEGAIAGVLVRQRQAINGTIECSAERVEGGLFRITTIVRNRTPFEVTADTTRDDALLRSLISTHTILGVRDGAFISLIDPPEACRRSAAECRNMGTWPVLVGEAGATDTMLSSPIILYDYPQIAPESPGDLYDSTEIDEILTLRIMTLTDQEKRAAAAIDERAGALLARTEALAREQLMNLHGTFRGLRPSPEAENFPAWDPLAEKKELERVLAAGIELRPGDHVILRPHHRADVFDLALAGKAATIAAIEQDYENRIQLAVTVDDDPGKDLGNAGKIAHRFFFHVDEVELVGAPAAR